MHVRSPEIASGPRLPLNWELWLTVSQKFKKLSKIIFFKF